MVIRNTLCKVVQLTKVVVTPAKLTDAKGMKHVCPGGRAIYVDKGDDVKAARQATAGKGVHLAAIQKNNMKRKDRRLSGIRSPYERVFSSVKVYT